MDFLRRDSYEEEAEALVSVLASTLADSLPAGR